MLSFKKVFINADDPIQLKHSAEIDSFTFSAVNSVADVLVINVQANPFVSLVHEGAFVQSQLIGLYNATNICAAIGLAQLEQIDGLLIFPYEYLSNSIIFVQTNFQIETFDSFIGNVIYNGKETNKFYADLMNRIRRRNYKGIKKIKL